MKLKKNINRRKFLGSAATAFAITVVPRHVLGGPQNVAPSDRVTIGYIGCGTQGIREMVRLVANPEIQIVAVCDPEKNGQHYVDWSKTGIRNSVRRLLEEPSWGKEFNSIPGGRDVGKDIVERYYAKNRGSERYNGCNAYADFRELLEKEKDLDGVKVMTPDHLHATISIAAMKKGKHVVIHKPVSNRVYENRLVVETARKTGVATHLLAWRNPSNDVRDMVMDGAIGTLREIHNWTDRPFWPQWQSYPTDRPRIPRDFDWDLWLGPVPDRPYHPNFTHAVFRGWYDFGAGSIADMGNYSLWPIFMAFDLGIPTSIEALPSSSCEIIDQVSEINPNDFSFPNACMIRFKMPARGRLGPIDLYWYDGGIRPLTTDDLRMDNRQMPATGTMFVGDKGTILGNQIVPQKKMLEYLGVDEMPKRERGRGGSGDSVWLDAFKGGEQSPGNFINARNVTETICLAGAALRYCRKSFGENRNTQPLEWDERKMQFTNIPEANEYLTREYRRGWKL